MCAGQLSRPHRCPRRVHRMPSRVRSQSAWNDRINGIAMTQTMWIVQLRQHRQPLTLAQFHRRPCNLPLVRPQSVVVVQHPEVHSQNRHLSHPIYGKSVQPHNNHHPYDSHLLRNYYSKVNNRIVALSPLSFFIEWFVVFDVVVVGEISRHLASEALADHAFQCATGMWNVPCTFNAPDLPVETLLDRTHNETLAKLNFVIALCDCILEVADAKCAPLSALMSADAAPIAPHAPENCKRSERLVLLVR